MQALRYTNLPYHFMTGRGIGAYHQVKRDLEDNIPEKILFRVSHPYEKSMINTNYGCFTTDRKFIELPPLEGEYHFNISF